MAVVCKIDLSNDGDLYYFLLFIVLSLFRYNNDELFVAEYLSNCLQFYTVYSDHSVLCVQSKCWVFWN